MVKMCCRLKIVIAALVVVVRQSSAQNVSTGRPSSVPLATGTPLAPVADVTAAPAVSASNATGSPAAPFINLTPKPVPTPTAPTNVPSNVSSDSPSIVPSFTPTGLSTDASTCFTNTTVLDEVLGRDSAFRQKTYTLCPNTVFEIGIQEGNNCCTDGMFPIFPKSNLLIQCGDDGSSANNCTFHGGSYHVFMAPFTSRGEPSGNVVIMGITFVEAALAGALIGNNGDITFIDCIFRDHTNSAPVLIAYEPPVASRRAAEYDVMTRGEQIAAFETEVAAILHNHDESIGNNAMRYEWTHNEESIGQNAVRDEWEDHDEPIGVNAASDEGDDHGRRLQIPEILTATFQRCVFANNVQSLNVSPLLQYGVFTIVGGIANIVVIDNCTFVNNTYNGQRSEVADGYAVKSRGADLTIRNTCFLRNDFIGFGQVQSYFNGTSVFEKNYADDSGTYCRFVATFSGMEAIPPSSSDVVCVDMDLNSCPFGNQSSNPGAPTGSPIAAPNGTPNQFPNAAPTGAPTESSADAVCAAVSLTLVAVAIPFWL